MTPQDPCEYLVIHYVPSPDQATGFAWLVLARSIDDSATPLKAVASAGWKEKVRPEDREYLSSLVEEWTQLCGQPAKNLFQHIDGFSTGPLRIESSGHSTFSGLDRKADSLLTGCAISAGERVLGVDRAKQPAP